MRRWQPTFRRAAADFVEDGMPLHAAALAFFTLLAIVPLFALAIVGARLALGDGDATRGTLGEGAQALLGDGRADALSLLLADAAPGEGGWLSLLVVALFLVFAAARLLAALETALNRIWDVKAEPRRNPGRLAWKRVLSFALLAGVGLLLLLALAGSALASALVRAPGAAWEVARIVVALAASWAVLAALYRFLPDAEVATRDAVVGAGLAAAGFAVGERLLGLALGTARLESVYGSLAGIVVAMLWFYYTSLIVLAGAEVAHARGAARGERAPPEGDIASPRGEKRGKPA